MRFLYMVDKIIVSNVSNKLADHLHEGRLLAGGGAFDHARLLKPTKCQIDYV